MTKYEVRNRFGEIVHPGDVVTDFRGDDATFLKVTRGTEYNGTAKVLVRNLGGEYAFEYYAQVFDLTVTTLGETD